MIVICLFFRYNGLMEGLFLKLIEQLNGAVFTLLGILIVIFWAIYKLGGLSTKFGKFEEERIETKKDLTEIKKDVAKITATVDLLYQHHLSTIKNRSPLSLTEKGEEISAALNIQEKVAVHWEEIKKKIEEKKPSNSYDIQTVSLDSARDCFESIFTEEDRSEIKQYAFKSGLNLLEFFPIIGIISRDRLLKEKGMDLGEVDKHNK